VVERTGDADGIADGIIITMDPRPLTRREQAVLEALLAIDFDGAQNLRCQIPNVVVVGRCGCGCPSIDFQYQQGSGMSARVSASISNSYDGLFLYTVDDPDHGEVLGGIEWVGVGDKNPDELPPPEVLDIQPA